MYHLAEIARITGAHFVGKNNYMVKAFLTDSRSLYSAGDVLFIALKTARNNGHNYIPSLIENGVRSFLVGEREFDLSSYRDSDISFIVSQDPLKSIQTLAAHHRQRFSIPVIGITGSNGKTVVKEWLYQLLKSNYSICRSPKSYNSQIGVPLSLLNLNESHTLGIFEAGISRPGEMEILASMIKPTFGVFTSFGTAHDEGFHDQAQKLDEKMKLFSGSTQLVIAGLEKNRVPVSLRDSTLFVSDHKDADLKISFKDQVLQLEGKEHSYKFRIPFSDMASVSNAATCAAVLLRLGLKEEEIAGRLLQLQAVALRLEIKRGINNSSVINDFYNSDLDSLKIAMNYLQQQKQHSKKIVIVSDIEQSGIAASALYKNLSDLFSSYKIDLVVGIGKEISVYKPLFRSNSLFFENTAAFVQNFRLINYQFADATILLKGARSFGFENISRLLQLKSHDTVFEVNLNRLTDNVNYYRSLISSGVQIMGMVKAMGYGSGSAEVARTLQHMGATFLAVAYADEGVELRLSNITLPIMIMSPEENAFEDIINYQLEPEIYHFHILKAFISKLDAMGVAGPFPVHIKIDTGMHRLGFEEQELEELVSILKISPQIKVKTIFSHLSASDNPALDDFTKEQIRVFEKAFHLVEKELGYKIIKHICNSGGITRFKEAHYDMVRLGIGMYGIGVNSEEQAHLYNVGTLRSRISQIKRVHKGQTVSYNRSGKIEKDTKIATIPIGYADGFSRLLGNGNHGMYVKGKFCQTVGNICMDMCMLDVTEVDCEEGDEVIIFETTAQINSLARALNTIPYEVLTSVSARVKRIYVQE